MLASLHIKNYALIDEIEIDFDPQLNVITGETGAGKSILMGALSLILGNRADAKSLFDDQQKCIIEGRFAISNYDLEAFFDEQDLDFEEETIIRREITPEGKSRAFVNDSPVNLSILKQLGEKLIDIHAQHATLQINTEQFQFFVLDSIANNEKLLAAYQQGFKRVKSITKQLTDAKEQARNASAELDFLQFQFNELEQADVQKGEQEELEQEQMQLENAEEIKRGLMRSNLNMEHGEQNVLTQLKEALHSLNQIVQYLPAVEPLLERLNSVHIEMKDIAAELDYLENQVVVDSVKLEEVNSRLSKLFDLQKKHHLVHADELIDLKNDLEVKLSAVSCLDEKTEQLEKELIQVQKETQSLGEQLATSRIAVVETVESHVQQIFTQVGMPNARLSIALQESEMRESGMQTIQYNFAANKGQELQPIHKVASGGELSRVMLAIKSMVAKKTALPTIVFDEIDTGISGEVALKVGDILQDLSADMQVIVISHLPQIASKGQTHFKVYKVDDELRTKSSIQKLDNNGRILEIAQMLSGSNPSEAAIKNAKHLLQFN